MTEERKILELYIPRGSKDGDKVVLPGEADQSPDQEPGDIVFNLVEAEHPDFRRAGPDLSARLEITLAEALCGFSRVVIKHLDGRGIHINHQQKGRILRPEQVLKVGGEGMPYKKSDQRGDLYLIVVIKFPEDGWLPDESAKSKLQELLPKPDDPIEVETMDEVDYDEAASLEDFGGKDEHGGGAWEDDDEDGQPQCAQQ